MKAVIDIGKTNVKLQLVDAADQLCDCYSRENIPIVSGPYPHADVAGIWQWLMQTLANYPRASEITALIVTTHGATAALVNSEALIHDIEKISREADGLVLPVLDYEFGGINECDGAYDALRPNFAETLSPGLPAGLNLGRQIFWLQQRFPTEFGAATRLLMYPQYWVWRLTGKLVGEITSLGCHTDLWSPNAGCYSSLVERCNWQDLMPPLRSAWELLGTVSPGPAKAMGLSNDCAVYVGLHDSNASYLRYLFRSPAAEPFTVISTGTWTILMQARGELTGLHHHRDTLGNCDIFGRPIACARFMGGREYDAICQRLGGNIQTLVTAQDIQSALDNLWMVTPDFSGGNGPYGGRDPCLSCPVPAPSAGAIATLYCALMIDQRLADLQATGPIYIEGAFLKNTLLCQLVAQLRSDQPVYLSTDDTGTVRGALLLTRSNEWTGKQNTTFANSILNRCISGQYRGLGKYLTHWYQLVAHSPSQKH